MDKRLPNLVWLRTFEAAARLLNFTEAGRELGLTQTAVSQHVKSLEETLGCRLFDRKPRNLELTAMGQAYVHSVRNALGDINLATTSLFGPAAKQTITIRAPIATATLFLTPLLPQFMAEHPEINIRLISTIWADSIADEDVDIDLRLGYGDWPGMQVERISTETIVPVCSIEHQGKIETAKDLLSGPFIHLLGHEDNWERYFSAHGLVMDFNQVRLFTDTTNAALSLVASGGGFATIMTRLAKSASGYGSEFTIAGQSVPFPQAHFLVNPVLHTAPRAEVDILRNWLRRCFSGDMD